MSDFEELFESKNTNLCFFLLRENDIVCIFRAFLKSMILNRKLLYVTDFELKKNTARQFLDKKTTTSHVLNF